MRHARVAAGDADFAKLLEEGGCGCGDPVLLSHKHAQHGMRAVLDGVEQGRVAVHEEAGVEIYEYQPTMFHCKMMIADGLMTSVGFTNFDMRSFRLNDEANLNLYDAVFSDRQTEVFELDLPRARRITLEAWQQRPRMEMVQERVAALFRAVL